jgi:hypothetical protein
MKSIRWFVMETLIAVTSAVLGWLLPDGLNRLAVILQQPPLTVTPIDRLLSAMVVFVFATSLQLIITTREGMRAMQHELPVSIQKVLDSSVLRLFLDNIAQSPHGVVSMERIATAAVSPLAQGHIGLLDARAVIVERALTNATQDIRLLGGAGLEVDIFDNNEITLRLASDCHSYRQIQRKAYQVPGEWTQTWMRFVAELGAKAVSCEYIVLMDRASFVSDRKKLDSMNQYLSEHHWDFYYCDLQDVLDSFGGVLPTEWNLEVFDLRIVKLQETLAGFYHGGVRLRVALYGLDERAELRRLDAAVTRNAKKYSPKLFDSA